MALPRSLPPLPSADRLLLAALVAVPILFNAVTLWPELTPVASTNDDVAHLLFAERASEAIDRGADPVDFWVPDLELGFPQFAYYQHLPHLAVVALDRITFRSLGVVGAFDLLRYLLLLGLPLTVLWSVRRLGLDTPGAVFSAASVSLLSTPTLLGIEYNSYLWRGYGVFTQLVAVHLFFVGLALLHDLLARGRGYAAATIALTALVLSHLLYAYLLALGSVVLLLAGSARRLPLRAARLGLVGLAAGIGTAYLLLPAALSAQYLNASPYLQAYKYDSYGAGQILAWLASGQLFDGGRVPILTALVAVGAAAAVRARTRPALLALALFATWLVLYFGRPTLGPLVDLLPFHRQLFLHRVLGAVQVAGVILIGVAGAWLWARAAPERGRWRLLGTAAIGVVALLPLLQERAGYYAANATWIAETKAAIDRDSDFRAIVGVLRTLPPGRVYAGGVRDWADELDFGLPFRSARAYNELTFDELPTVAPPVQGPSLNADLIADLDPSDPAHYAVFGISYVIAPARRELPAFLVPLRRTGRYVLYEAPGAPGNAVARFAAVSDTVRVPSAADLLPVQRAWLLGPGPAAGTVLRLELPASPAGATGAALPGCPAGGTIAPGRVTTDSIAFTATCPTAATLILPITYHPGWRVLVDGEPVPTFMATPSVIGLSVPAGTHAVRADYRSDPAKAPLLALGLLTLGAVVLARRRIERLDDALARRWPR